MITLQLYHISKFKLLSRVITPICCILFLNGCVGYASNYRTQAPFDSFVCHNKSLDECAKLVSEDDYEPVPVKASQQWKPPSFIFPDPDAGKTQFTADHRFPCQNGVIPYKQKLDPHQKYFVVFYSPIALSQAAETYVKLTRARESCNRLIQSYDFQKELLLLQDEQAKNQLAVQYLTARVENDNLLKSQVALEMLSSDDLNKFGIPPTPSKNVADWLQNYRNQVTQISEQLRNKYKQQSLDVDFKKQFADSQLVIDSLLRELGRELFLLDRAVSIYPNYFLTRSFYKTGTWVRQGTDIGEIQPNFTKQ